MHSIFFLINKIKSPFFEFKNIFKIFGEIISSYVKKKLFSNISASIIKLNVKNFKDIKKTMKYLKKFLQQNKNIIMWVSTKKSNKKEHEKKNSSFSF